jgi:hypothetical protein
MLIEYRGGRGLTGIERGVDCLRGTRQGHASDCAENGVEAVGACASQRYDLILMVSRVGRRMGGREGILWSDRRQIW